MIKNTRNALLLCGLVLAPSLAFGDYIYRLTYDPSAIRDAGGEDPVAEPPSGPDCSDVSVVSSLDPGTQCNDGAVLTGLITGSHYLFVTPGGCDFEPGGTPTTVTAARFDANCPGGIDTTTKQWYAPATGFAVGTLSPDDGAGNTAAIIATPGSYPAATYCANMDYGGHSDWYLPAKNEHQQLRRAFINHTNPGAFTFNEINIGYYSTSTESATLQDARTTTFSLTRGFSGGIGKITPAAVRCMRKLPV